MENTNINKRKIIVKNIDINSCIIKVDITLYKDDKEVGNYSISIDRKTMIMRGYSTAKDSPVSYDVDLNNYTLLKIKQKIYDLIKSKEDISNEDVKGKTYTITF